MLAKDTGKKGSNEEDCTNLVFVNPRNWKRSNSGINQLSVQYWHCLTYNSYLCNLSLYTLILVTHFRNFYRLRGNMSTAWHLLNGWLVKRSYPYNQTTTSWGSFSYLNSIILIRDNSKDL